MKTDLGCKDSGEEQILTDSSQQLKDLYERVGKSA